MNDNQKIVKYIADAISAKVNFERNSKVLYDTFILGRDSDSIYRAGIVFMNDTSQIYVVVMSEKGFIEMDQPKLNDLCEPDSIEKIIKWLNKKWPALS